MNVRSIHALSILVAAATSGCESGPLVDSSRTSLRTGDRVTADHVTDGDTIEVKAFRGPEELVWRIRLLGLSSPECRKANDAMGRLACKSDDEPYGKSAYDEIVKLLPQGRELGITCDVAAGEDCPADNWGRTLAYLELNGLDLSTEMARAGAGMSFTRYPASRRAAICRAEEEAQAAKRGMWAQGNIDQVLATMSANTREWHARRDELCAGAEQ